MSYVVMTAAGLDRRPGCAHGLEMQAYAVISRDGATSSDLIIYVAAVGSKDAALDAVRAKYGPTRDIEISGSVDQATIQALGLRDGEVRRL